MPLINVVPMPPPGGPFLAVNGGAIAGNAGVGAYERDLAYFPTVKTR